MRSIALILGVVLIELAARGRLLTAFDTLAAKK